MYESTVLKLKILYFISWSGAGIWYPYVPVFFEALAMSKSQIGFISMVPNISAITVAPIFGYIGDRYDSHTDIMLMAIIVPAIATVGMLFVRSFWTMLWVVVIRSFFNCPLSAQIDSLTMSTIKDSSTYGTLRLWGAVSFGIFSFVGGALLTPAPVNVTSEASQWGFGFVFYGSALLTLVSGFVVLSIMFDKLSTTPAALAAGRQVQGAQSLELPELPVSSPQQEQQQGKRDPADRGVYTHVSTSEEESPGVEQRSLSGGNGITSYEKYARKGGIGGREERGGGGGSIGLAAVNGDTIAVWRHITILESLRNVLRQHPESSAFAVIVFLSGVGSGVIETFLFLHLKALGGSGLVMGLARFLTCAAEVPMFQLAGTLQRRYGTWALLALTQLAFAVRFFYYALLRSAWAVLPCELLHGLTFATTWSVSVTYAKHIAPPHCHSLMQTLLGGLHFGLGAGVGSLLGGLVYERVGARLLFTSCGLLSVSSLTIALVAWHICGSNETKAVALEDKEVAAPLSS